MQTNISERTAPLAASNDLRGMLREIKSFASENGLSEIFGECNHLEQRYYYMLRSMASGTPDPNQSDEQRKMCRQAQSIALRAQREASLNNSNTLYMSYARYASLRPQESLPTLAVDFLTEQAKVMSDPLSYSDSSRRAPLERLSRDIFHRLWVEFPLDEDSSEAVRNLISETDIPLVDRESWIGALILGMLETPDPARFALLGHAASLNDNIRIRAAAFSGLFFAAYFFTGSVYADDVARIWNGLKADDPDFASDMRRTILEYAGELGTAAVEKTMDQRVIPHLSSISLNLNRFMNGFNPEGKSMEEVADALEKFGAESGAMDNGKFTDAMKLMNSLSAEGADVLFSMLKTMHQQHFFDDVANWWIPFDSSRSEFAEIFADQGAILGEMFENLDFMCDSDKYAVLLVAAMSPTSMRTQTLDMMVKQYSMMNSQLEKSEDATGDELYGKAVRNYMRNIYRFYRLFRRKGEFADPFGRQYGFNSSKLVCELYSSYDDTQAIAERLTKAGYSPFAYPFYLGLLNSPASPSADLLMEAADSAEAAGNRDQAVEWMYRARESSSDPDRRLRITTRIMEMLTNAGRPADAIKALDGFDFTDASDPDLLSMLGRRTLSLEKSELARDILQQAVYLYPDDTDSKLTNARLFLAVSQYMSGNVLEALDIFDSLNGEVLDSRFFLIRKAHMLMATHQFDKAFDTYRMALKFGFDRIQSDLQHELKVFSQYGLGQNEVRAMIDALYYSQNPGEFGIPFNS